MHWTVKFCTQPPKHCIYNHVFGSSMLIILVIKHSIPSRVLIKHFGVAQSVCSGIHSKLMIWYGLQSESITLGYEVHALTTLRACLEWAVFNVSTSAMFKNRLKLNCSHYICDIVTKSQYLLRTLWLCNVKPLQFSLITGLVNHC